MFYLVVVRPFGAYRIGDVINEAAAIDKIVGSEHSEYVVRVTAKSEG